jgi:antitoxin PrlF
VIPREVCEQLKLKLGDTLRFRLTYKGILLDKVTEAGDPFAAFSEWMSEADDKAFADL